MLLYYLDQFNRDWSFHAPQAGAKQHCSWNRWEGYLSFQVFMLPGNFTAQVVGAAKCTYATLTPGPNSVQLQCCCCAYVCSQHASWAAWIASSPYSCCLPLVVTISKRLHSRRNLSSSISESAPKESWLVISSSTLCWLTRVPIVWSCTNTHL